jgi:hypothetical protein
MAVIIRPHLENMSEIRRGFQPLFPLKNRDGTFSIRQRVKRPTTAPP